jgi:hypothetical protein
VLVLLAGTVLEPACERKTLVVWIRKMHKGQEKDVERMVVSKNDDDGNRMLLVRCKDMPTRRTRKQT